MANFFEENGFDQTLPMIKNLENTLEIVNTELTSWMKEYAENKPGNMTDVEKKEWNKQLMSFTHHTNQLLHSVVLDIRKNKLGGMK